MLPLKFWRELVACRRSFPAKPNGLEQTSGTIVLSFCSGCLPAMARVFVGADVIPGPAVKAAFGDVSDVVGRKVAEGSRLLTEAQSTPVVD